ncbi:MAG: MFS transporter [Halieaceae bacterium]|jgi:MFS family permease|nr:MFS transporter [Halieaceae bacterium]
MPVRAVASLWPLFFGLLLLGLALGVQGSLLGIRADLEGFETWSIGLIMSAYFVGFLAGSLLTPNLIAAVGHIRTFGAATALASITILIHATLVEPSIWVLARLVTGFAFSTVYVVSESWLNSAASNETRGQMLAYYMVTLLAGITAGQMMLNLADPAEVGLFVLISVMVSLAAIPILMTVLPAPTLESQDRVSIRHLWKRAPLGVIGIVLNQWCSSVVFSFGAVYAARRGMSVAEIATFMTAIMGGAMVLQWPLGRLSDVIDRRWVLGIGSIVGALTAAWAGMQPGHGGTLLLAAFLFGGFCLSQYSIVVALIHDHLRPTEIVPASGTIVLVSGLVAVSGPPSMALAVDWFGIDSFFVCLAGMLSLMAAINIWRARHVPPLPGRYKTQTTLQSPVSPVGTVLHADEKIVTLDDLLEQEELDTPQTDGNGG